MAQGVGTNVRISYVPEVTRGTTPASPSMKFLRVTSRPINLKKDALESQEVSQSRQQVDVRHGFNRVEGTFGFEWSLGSFDEVLAYLLGRAKGNQDPADITPPTAGNYNGWLKPPRVIDATTPFDLTIPTVVLPSGSTPGTITFRLTNAAANRNWIDLGYRPGDWVVSKGWTDQDNNTSRDESGAVVVGATGPDRWRVINIVNSTNSDLICQIPVGFTGQAVQGTGNATVEVRYAGRRISIGTELNTVTFERGFTDVPLYQLFRGCAFNTMGMSIKPTEMVGGSLGIIGMSAVIDGTASVDANPDVISTSSPFSAFDGVALCVKANGDHINAVVTGIDFNLDNQRTLFPVVGSKFSQDVYDGIAKIGGTITLLLDSVAHLTAFQNEEALNSLTIRLNDLDTAATTAEFVSLTFHRVKYMAADMDPGQNGPVLVTIPFIALEQQFVGFTTTTFVTKEAFRIQRSTSVAA